MKDFEKLGAFYLGKQYDLDRGATMDDLLMYDSKDLTTHAVCVGMTGSGKTGLCLSLLEEAAIDGIPAIAIDPKGDLGNLLLTFPNLSPDDFRPCIDPAEATRQGMEIDEYAKKTAAKWRKELAAWGQEPSRIAKLREAVDISIYTPGSTAGLPLTVMRSFAAPTPAVMNDNDAFRERIMSAVSGLLALLGVDADPIRSREHILLSNIFDHAWPDGRNLDLAGLIREIQSPPFTQVGVMDLDTIFPSKDRFGLAMQLNNLLASPGFSVWMTGDPLDVSKLLYGESGRPRLTILSIAHLSDAERMFFVTILLNEVVAWMRSQPGTGSLRALLYMDEVLEEDARFASLAPALTRAKSYTAWEKSLKNHLYRSQSVMVYSCKSPKEKSLPGESEADFRVRLKQHAFEQRDLQVEKLRKKFAPKLKVLTDRMRRYEQRVEREESQLKQQSWKTALSYGTTVLGAMLGRKLGSSTNMSRAATSMRAAGKIASEKGDIGRAKESLEAGHEQLAEMEEQFKADAESVRDKFSSENLEIKKTPIRPRKADLSVEQVCLIWTPWTVDSNGIAERAY